MLLLKYLLMWGGIAMMVIAAGMLLYDLYLEIEYRKARAAGGTEPLPPIRPVRWRGAIALALLGWGPILIALGIVVVPSGMAGVRVSQTKGTLAGTLYPGIHFVTPLAESVALFDTRDQLFTTGMREQADKVSASQKSESLAVQAKEGLTLGLAITVRYRLDPRRLDYIQANLPQPVEKEIVPAVVASAWRELVPNYTVRDVFAARREEVRRRAAEVISGKLGADGILVKEVVLRDIQLPPEYAKGLENLLLKEQESDRMAVEVEIRQKMVRTAELEAEAERVRRVKQAEGEAQIVVISAKAQADAIQHTLPLKQKQIEQTRLESEARKEATVKNAEAQAQAKVIDSRAELEKRKLMAEAEANRIRVTAAADSERMQTEAAALKQNPLLI